MSTVGDLEFRNARVLDGTGRPAFTAHVLVSGGQIERIGETPAGADREIDLGGAYLAPGFIDMHAHSELRLFDEPGAPEKLTQGVTTEVLGQDGVSVAPVPGALREEWAERIQAIDGSLEGEWSWNTVDTYLAELSEAEPAVNCAYYVPHGNLRSLFVGFEDRPIGEADAVAGWLNSTTVPDPGRTVAAGSAPGTLGALQEELATALDEGAFGLSTGLIYPPSSYARDRELLALAETLANRDSLMVSHVWNETDRVVESIDRYLDICRRGGCHAHVSHLKVGGRNNWGGSTEILELFDEAERAGQRVSFDQYPYTAGSTMLSALLPPWARKDDTETMIERLEDPETVAEIAADIQAGGDWENLAQAAGDWDNILITATASGAEQGRTIAEIAEGRETGPVPTVCDLLVAEDLDVTMADFIMSESDIQRFLADDRGTFCTDGIFGGKPHPRTMGTFARLIERYVDERGVVSPERLVRKAAGRPADVLGLRDRGYVREGYIADLVIFDVPSVSENATYERPRQLSDGFEYVLVGGEVAVRDGEPTGTHNGDVLRSAEEWGGPKRPELDRGAD